MAKTGNADTQRMTFIAADNLKTTTARWKVAYISASMTAALASGAADKVIGIVDSDQSESSDNVTVIVHGLAKGVMLSLTVAAAGDFLIPTTMGTLNVYVTNTTAQIIVGMALESSRTGGAVSLFVRPTPFGIKV